MNPPSFSDILLAKQKVARYLPRTPLFHYPALDKMIGAEILVKHENYQPVGAFKVRGGINLISQLSPAERGRGVIAASTGNHGQSVAYAARLFGASDSLLEISQSVLAPADKLAYDQDAAIVRANLEPSTFDEVWAAGYSCPLERIIAEALDGRVGA